MFITIWIIFFPKKAGSLNIQSKSVTLRYKKHDYPHLHENFYSLLFLSPLSFPYLLSSFSISDASWTHFKYPALKKAIHIL